MRTEGERAAGPAPAAPGWRVEDLGLGVHLFRWDRGFYASPFLVTSEGVVAFDPIDREAATAYRQAIAGVTPAPVVALVYSHDHRDHIVGGDRLVTAGAAVLARPECAQRIARRGDPDILPPTRLLGDEEELRFGDRTILTHHWGPNHSPSTLAYELATGGGRLLVFCDVVEPGVPPYRELPDSDVPGLLHSLRMAERLGCDLVMGGHCGPDRFEWVGWYREYFEALLEAARAEWEGVGGQRALPGEDGVAMTERVRSEACRRTAERLAPRFGAWRGFARWAPLNADRVLSYLITGA